MESARLRQWLTRLAPVYPGEGPVVGLCFLINFLVVAGIMFGRTSRDSLFLVYFGVQYLPYMYFANAASLILCSLVYTTLVDRFERGKFLGAVSLLFVTSLVVSRLALFGHPRWVFPVLYIEAQVIWYFSLMQFWTFVGDLFDTRQAKRLFPFLAVGALLGMISVGLVSKLLVRAVGTENLLVVWAGLIFAALVLAAVVHRKYRAVKEPEKRDAASLPPPTRPSEWQKIKEGVQEVGREPLLRSMAGYILLLWTVYAIVDFSFNKTVRSRYPDPNDLTTFLGRFIGIAGFCSLVVQLFLTRAVIARLGVGTTINFHPAFLVLGTGWMSAVFAFPSVLATKLADHVLLYTFSDSSFQLLYNPVPQERRARVRGFIEGYIRPLSLAAAGAVVLAANKYLKPLTLGGREIDTIQQLAWIALVLSAVWFGVALTAKKGYIRALLKNLQAASPAVRQAAATALAKLKDPSSVGILAETLRSASPDRVIAAMQFLESFGAEEAHEALVELLRHPDARVRATAVSTLGRRAASKYVDRVTLLLEDSDARVRANAVEALAMAEDPNLVEKLRPLLRDPSTRARVNTVLTIAAIQGVSTALESLPLIRELMQGDEKARSTATFALGRLPLEQSVDLLQELLTDPEPRIRREAAQALGRIGSPSVIPSLVEALAGSPELRRMARQSLVAIAQKHGPEITRQLEATALASERAETRSELADVLGRLKDPQVVETLIRLLQDPEWRVKWKVLKSFERLARTAPLAEAARTALFNYAREELAAFRWSLRTSQAIVADPHTEAERLLGDALAEDRHNIQERVFHMLAVLCGRERMLAIFEKLQSGDARLRADAFEALDTLAPREVGRELLALLEPAPAAASAKAEPTEPLLAALASHAKPWMRACTAYYLGHHPNGQRGGMLTILLADRDRLVRETALYAGWLAFRDDWWPQVEAARTGADPALTRSALKILAQRQTQAGRGTPATERSRPMLLTVEKAVFLKSAPLFAALEGEELAALAEIALEHEYPSGETIFEEGQPPHHLYVIVEGKVEVFRRVGEAERPLAHLGERECFGEMAILDDLPRSASVRAVEPTLVLKIDRDSFRDLIQERPQIAFAIFRILSGRLRQQNLEADHTPTVYSGGQYA